MPQPQLDSRCAFSFLDGRRCRMLVMPGGTDLCLHHHRQMLRRYGIPVREQLLARNALDNLWAIRRLIKQTARDVASGRLTPAAGEVLLSAARFLRQHTRRGAKRPKPRHPAA